MTEIGDGHSRRWAILALVLAAECMDLLDGTIVNVAAPAIRTELHASTAALQWIIGRVRPRLRDRPDHRGQAR